MVDVGHGLVDIRNSLGAVFLGGMVSLPLTGLITLQTYYYYNTYPKDSRDMKLLVLGMWLLDIAHSGLIIGTMWYYFVLQYGNISSLLYASPLIYISGALHLVTAVVAQLFFARRIFKLASTKTRWWLWSFLVMLIAGHAVFGLVTTIGLFQDLRISHNIELKRWLILYAGFSLMAEASIAGCLCTMLHSRRTGFHGTNKILTSLVLYAINRCLLTSASALTEIIMFLAWPSSEWFLAIDFINGKLHANSLLATLNARLSLQIAGASTGENHSRTREVPLTNLRFADRARPGDSTDITMSQAGSGLNIAAGTAAPAFNVTIAQSNIGQYEEYVFEGEAVDTDEAIAEQKSSHIVA